ncbi:hypothetical protein BJX62DRAFT_246163 [Aspergillus germanicus]
MWTITTADSESTIWCSDGEHILNVSRGGPGESSRLIVDGKGFLDVTELNMRAPDPDSEYILIDADLNLTEVQIPSSPCGKPLTDIFSKAIDANGLKLYHANRGEAADPPLPLHLKVNPDDATFTLSIISDTPAERSHISADTSAVTGKLKPLPHISAADAAYFDTMIASDLVPYACDESDVPGKSHDEIRALGLRLFPFSPYSFQLAIAIYDWTTASFARMVYVDMFRNWGPFTAQNAQFMASLLMKPAWSRLEVELQLLDVRDDLVCAVEVEDRLLAAAMRSLPRTSTLSRPRLFSGQLDMAHLDIESFGIEFVECPMNQGPVCRPLRETLDTALATYLAVGRTVTTKVTWSFTDTVEHALHYSNGILLILDHASPCVWESVSYVTPLSNDPKKIEYTAPPGSRFRVLSSEEATYNERQFLVLTFQPIN